MIFLSYSVERFVYARHGRELMGLKSPVSVPVLGVNLTQITSRRQGRYREVGSEGSQEITYAASCGVISVV